MPWELNLRLVFILNTSNDIYTQRLCLIITGCLKSPRVLIVTTLELVLVSTYIMSAI